MSILTTSDFVGKHLVVLNGNATTTAEFNSIIADVEKRYLRKLLGYDLYHAFITGLAESTPLTKWTKLRDGDNYKTYDVSDENELNTITKVFEGVKEMLKYFTRLEWYNYTRFARRNIGVLKPDAENSEVTSSDSFQDSQILIINAGVDIWNDAIEFIMECNFEQQILSWSGNTATVITTRYLANGDTIKIDGVSKTVSNVTATTFDVDITSGGSWQKYFYPNPIFEPQRKKVLGID